MTDYVKSTNFSSKDALPSGNPSKIAKGTEIDTEFNAIATAVATKADSVSPAFTGNPTAPTQTLGDSSTKLATTAFVQKGLESLYPVGSIYINAAVSTNPATLFGFGTWTAFGAGRVMVGFDSGDTLFDTVGETGGSKDAAVVSHTHTLTDPGHDHSSGLLDSGSSLIGSGLATGPSTTIRAVSVGAQITEKALLTSTETTGITVDSAGTSGTNANLQPYITVYMWKRTA